MATSNIDIAYSDTSAFTVHTDITPYFSDIEFDYELENIIDEKGIGGDIISVPALRLAVKITFPVTQSIEFYNWGTNGADYFALMNMINSRFKTLTLTDTNHPFYKLISVCSPAPIFVTKNYSNDRWGSNRTKKIVLELLEYQVRFMGDLT